MGTQLAEGDKRREQVGIRNHQGPGSSLAGADRRQTAGDTTWEGRQKGTDAKQ